ncbi:hypothetical protein HDU91_001351 [Kappamyces sp. JEL0680]|nr:hypothetical protein HDU91_001351 [Kappamyces sp. JEL0680]
MNGRFFTANDGRTLFLRGVNLSGSVKQPFTPRLPSHQPNGFFDGQNVSFVGRPFPLHEADEHFARLKLWGFNFLRFNITWEALEHSGPGIYDQEYMQYVCEILLKAKEYGFRAFIDPHQDVWSRFTGGSGAPLWTLQMVGFNVENFANSYAALVQNVYPDPAQFPKMIWPTNYFKLATATMFTLFFGGSVFAPQCKVNGVNIQDYLQSHYFNAVAELAKRIVNTPGLADDVVVGYDTLNEPSMGWLGVEDIREVAREQELRKGLTPTPLQAMILGMGLSCDNVEEWDMTSVGPQKMAEKTLDPKGNKAWLNDTRCIWAQHGVWDPDTKECLSPDYFHFHPKTRKKVEALRDFWKPFVNKFTLAIRAAHPGTMIFVEPPVNGIPPAWEEGDAVQPLVFAPHWYDGLTLVGKHWNPWYNVDYIGFLRGKYSSVAFAVKFGEAAIKKAFQSQLRMLRQEGEDALGKCPTVFGEIGIPYDMDGKAAYLTGDYSGQIQAMDANMTALERDLLSFTLWNYTSDNSHQWGDQWNGEDLSLWSPPLSTIISPRIEAEQRKLPEDLNDGARALEAFVRPFPIAVPGTPKSISFDLVAGTFTFSFTHAVGDDGLWDPLSLGLSATHAEIFLPAVHFPTADSFQVWTSSGDHSVHLSQQRLIWTCGCRESNGDAIESSNSESSAVPLTKGKVADASTVTHKIVIQKTHDAARNPADIALAMDQEDEPICPTICSLM